LFHRAINQSGPFLQFESRETSRAMVEEVMRQLGLARGDVDKLQDMPVDRLVGAAAEMMKKLGAATPVFRRQYGLAGWWPAVDGAVLPRHPFDPDAPSVSAHVPLITGTVFNEITNALDGGGAMTEAELQKGVGEAFGANGPAIIAAYRRDWPHATAFEIHAAIAAEPFRRAAFEQAARKAMLDDAPSYVYVYNWRTPMLDGRPGTFHACDLAFTFDNAVRCSQYSGLRPEALAMSKRIAGAYVAFARTGNPNHPGLPHWPAHTRDGATMVFDNVCKVRKALEADGLKLIAKA
jgi:para-nitrobenzyl esterase